MYTGLLVLNTHNYYHTIISSLDDMEALQGYLNRLKRYCHVNKLNLNLSKCPVIAFNRKRMTM